MADVRFHVFFGVSAFKYVTVPYRSLPYLADGGGESPIGVVARLGVGRLSRPARRSQEPGFWFESL